MLDFSFCRTIGGEMLHGASLVQHDKTINAVNPFLSS